jgi:hypothetical protein
MNPLKSSSRGHLKTLKDLKKLRIPSAVYRNTKKAAKSVESCKSNPKFKKMPKLGKLKFKSPATPCEELNHEYD